jgi:hypothetical protein
MEYQVREFIPDSVFDGKIVLSRKTLPQINNMHRTYAINKAQSIVECMKTIKGLA